MIDVPAPHDSLVIRTDFSDDDAWKRICNAIGAPNEDFRAYVTLISDVKCLGLNATQVAALLPPDFQDSFIFIVDETAVSHAEHPVLVVDLFEERGRTFRVIPSECWGIENNLSIANMDFHEFAENVDADGIFRGFR